MRVVVGYRGALALLRGRDHVLPADLREIASDVLAHRLALSFDVVADGVQPGDIVRRIVDAVPLPVVAPSQESGLAA